VKLSKVVFKIQIDAAKIAAQFKEFASQVETDLRKSMGDLASMTHAKVLEMAQAELKTSRKTYTDNLGFEEVSPGVWVVSLAEPAMWVEEGIEPDTDMKPALLKNGTVGKNGNRYKVIPFNYSRPGSQNSSFTNQIVNDIRQRLKKENVPFKKIEYNKDGSPKTGKLHEFNFGGEKPGKGNTPAMKGVSIYQSITKTGNVRRDILTFRTVSSGAASAEKWIHPGLKGKKYMDVAADWAIKEWENKILPEVMKKWEK
jgi:hypothetical protein